MSQPLRVLIVDDSEGDAELLLRELRRGEYRLEHVRVDTAEALAAELDSREWDAIISDYVIPGFGGLAALKLVREKGLDLPFIVVSGKIDEEIAVETMKAGAHDFVVKGNMARLVPAIQRELREAIVRRERREADEALHRAHEELRKAHAELEMRVEQRTAELAEANVQLRDLNGRLVSATMQANMMAEEAERRAAEQNAIVRSIADGLVVYGPDGETVYANPVAESLLQIYTDQGNAANQGILPLGHIETADGELYPQDDLPSFRALHGESTVGSIMAIRHPSGRSLWLSSSGAPIKDSDDNLLGAVVTFTDITERKEAEQLREEYVHLISHDLRNPITSLMGFAQLLVRSLEQKGLQQDLSNARNILTSARRMNAMIQDLVETSRLEAGRQDLRKDLTDVLSLVYDIIERIGSAEDRARIKVVDSGFISPVAVDLIRIERAVVNLVTNALKYSPQDTSVVVEVSQRSGEAVISVTDHGTGIPPEELPLLFQRFYRAKAGRKTDGLGLGLYIARLVAEAHGGSVWVESEIGKGSTFCLSLPLQ